MGKTEELIERMGNVSAASAAETGLIREGYIYRRTRNDGTLVYRRGSGVAWVTPDGMVGRVSGAYVEYVRSGFGEAVAL